MAQLYSIAAHLLVGCCDQLTSNFNLLTQQILLLASKAPTLTLISADHFVNLISAEGG
jgi:uncharacterized protein YcfL